MPSIKIIKKSYFMEKIEEIIEQIPPLPKMVYKLLKIKDIYFQILIDSLSVFDI